MKIVYCINSIRVLGGIERVTVVKANALAEVPGNEVYIVVLTDKKGCYTEVPSPKVKVVDLDAEFFPNGSPRSRIAYVWQSLKYAKAYQRKLSAFLHKLNPEIENQPLLRQMGKHAKETVQHYYPEALT